MTLECAGACQAWGLLAGACIGAAIVVQVLYATSKHLIKGICPQHPGSATCVHRGDQFGRRDK